MQSWRRLTRRIPSGSYDGRHDRPSRRLQSGSTRRSRRTATEIDSNYASASVSNLLTGSAVWQLAQHYQRSPDQLSDEELRQYFLYLTNEKKMARPTATIALCGIKFFYEQTLKQALAHAALRAAAARVQTAGDPEPGRGARILAVVRIPVYRACLTTIYACGLRLLEGTQLQVPDVDSARMLLHIHGKGKKDRYVPLPQSTLKLLRAHWRTHRSPLWLFPAPTRHGLAIVWRMMVAQ